MEINKFHWNSDVGKGFFPQEAFYAAYEWEADIVWNKNPPIDPSTIKPPEIVKLQRNEDLIENDWEENIIFDTKELSENLYPYTDPKYSEEAPILTELKDFCIPIYSRNVSNDSFYETRTPHQKAMINNSLNHMKIVNKLNSQLLASADYKDLEWFYHPILKPFKCKEDSLQKKFYPVNILGNHISEETESNYIVSRLKKPNGLLSAQSGNVIITEFLEEYPPLVNQIGMRAKIKLYFKNKASVKQSSASSSKLGETAIAHTNVFLGTLQPEESLLAMENALYRSIMHEHKTDSRDFLLIRYEDAFYLRKIDYLFAKGQEYPLQIVPEPNSKKCLALERDFVQVFIYCLFWQCKKDEKYIHFDAVRQAFPNFSEKIILKRLKDCADFKQNDKYPKGIWVLKPQFRLTSQNEIRAMVSAEDYCAYFSMLMAKQRLKNIAGYGEHFFNTPQDDDDDLSAESNTEDEILAAPWNTTRAYVRAMENKCVLALEGPADPTGRGLGFSFTRLPIKRPQKFQPKLAKKVIVEVANLELSRITKPRAKAMLRDLNVSEEFIKKLKRTEMIQEIEKLKLGRKEEDNNESIDNTFQEMDDSPSSLDRETKFKIDSERIFHLQNLFLSDSSKTYVGEENVVNRLGQMREKSLEHFDNAVPKPAERVLAIQRKIIDEYGELKTITYIFTKESIVNSYEKIRNTKDERFIKSFLESKSKILEASMEKQRPNREKQRRMQMSKIRKDLSCVKKYKRQRISKKKLKASELLKSLENEPSENELESGKNTVNAIDGMTSFSFDSKTNQKFLENIDIEKDLMNEFNEYFCSALSEPSSPEENSTNAAIIAGKDLKIKEKTNEIEEININANNQSIEQSINIDPIGILSGILQEILDKLILMPEFQKYLFNHDLKSHPEYTEKISFPMDLQMIQEKLDAQCYKNSKDFIKDLQQFYKNIVYLYGLRHLLALTALSMQSQCLEWLEEKHPELLLIEKTINLLQDDVYQAALTHNFQTLLGNIKLMKEYGTLTEIIGDDFQSILTKVQSHNYYCRSQLLKDFLLLVKGNDDEENEISKRFSKLVDFIKADFAEDSEFYETLEALLKHLRDESLKELSEELNFLAKQREIEDEIEKGKENNLNFLNLDFDEIFGEGNDADENNGIDFEKPTTSAKALKELQRSKKKWNI